MQHIFLLHRLCGGALWLVVRFYFLESPFLTSLLRSESLVPEECSVEELESGEMRAICTSEGKEYIYRVRDVSLSFESLNNDKITPV